MSLRKGKHIIFLKTEEDVDVFFRLNIEIPVQWDAPWMKTEVKSIKSGVKIYTDSGKVSGWNPGYVQESKELGFSRTEWVLPHRRKSKEVCIEDTIII